MDMGRKLKHTPTAKLKAIVESGYLSLDGKVDYVDYKDEINRILWRRTEKELEKKAKERMRQIKAQNNIFRKMLDGFKQELKKNGDSLCLRNRIMMAMDEYTNFINAI